MGGIYLRYSKTKAYKLIITRCLIIIISNWYCSANNETSEGEKSVSEGLLFGGRWGRGNWMEGEEEGQRRGKSGENCLNHLCYVEHLKGESQGHNAIFKGLKMTSRTKNLRKKTMPC